MSVKQKLNVKLLSEKCQAFKDLESGFKKILKLEKEKGNNT